MDYLKIQKTREEWIQKTAQDFISQASRVAFSFMSPFLPTLELEKPGEALESHFQDIDNPSTNYNYIGPFLSLLVWRYLSLNINYGPNSNFFMKLNFN